MPIFAQVPDALQFGGWLLSAAAFLVIVKNGSELVRMWRGKPNPEQLELTGDILGKRMDVMENTIDYVRKDGDDRRRAMYEKMDCMKDEMNEAFNKNGREVSALQNNMDLVNARLVQMDTKLDRLNERGKH